MLQYVAFLHTPSLVYGTWTQAVHLYSVSLFVPALMFTSSQALSLPPLPLFPSPSLFTLSDLHLAWLGLHYPVLHSASLMWRWEGWTELCPEGKMGRMWKKRDKRQREVLVRELALINLVYKEPRAQVFISAWRLIQKMGPRCRLWREASTTASGNCTNKCTFHHFLFKPSSNCSTLSFIRTSSVLRKLFCFSFFHQKPARSNWVDIIHRSSIFSRATPFWT